MMTEEEEAIGDVVQELNDLSVEKQLQDAVIEDSTQSHQEPATLSEKVMTSDLVNGTTASPIESLNITEATTPAEIVNCDDNTSGLFGWLGGSSLMSRMVQSTRDGIETVITTLDPGMKNYIRSGGAVYLAVASDCGDTKFEAMRDAFQTVFGRATVEAFPISSNSLSAVQPVGLSALRQACEQRLKHLRHDHLHLTNVAALSVESGIVELMPERWFEMTLLLLHDPELERKGCCATFEVISAATPLPIAAVTWLQDHTTVDYPLRWSGLAYTLVEALQATDPSLSSSWHEALTGVHYFDIIIQAGMILAGLYKRDLIQSDLKQL